MITPYKRIALADNLAIHEVIVVMYGQAIFYDRVTAITILQCIHIDTCNCCCIICIVERITRANIHLLYCVIQRTNIQLHLEHRVRSILAEQCIIINATCCQLTTTPYVWYILVADGICCYIQISWSYVQVQCPY